MQQSATTHNRLGAKLRELRTQRGLSVRSFAAQVGFSPSFISQLEADAASPSIASLEKIAGALGVTLGQLFSSLEQNTAARTVVRHAERATYTSSWSHSTIAVLADAAPERQLSAVEITIAPGGASGPQLATQAHDTFALLLRGTLLLHSEFAVEELSVGDAVYLSEGKAFMWVNQSALPATLVLIGSNGRANLMRVMLADVQDSLLSEGV